MHLLELDQIIGERFLVTVHGPLNPAVDPVSVRVVPPPFRCRGLLRGQPGLEQQVMQSQLKVNTKMTVAMERLAVIAAVTLQT